MFKGLFKKHVQNDDIFEVDPVVEQRRKVFSSRRRHTRSPVE